jgi:hypothetical protein
MLEQGGKFWRKKTTVLARVACCITVIFEVWVTIVPREEGSNFSAKCAGSAEKTNRILIPHNDARAAIV